MTMLQKVFSRATDQWILCVWCVMHGHQRPGYEMHKAVFHEHSKDIPCHVVEESGMGSHVNYVFCSDRHKRYFQNSHIEMGNLPSGYGKDT